MNTTNGGKPPVMPLRPMSRQGIRARLEQAREDVAQLMAGTLYTQQQLHAVLAITDDLWLATQPDEAPEFELATRVVRAS